MPKTAFLELRDELEAAHAMSAIKLAIARFGTSLGYCWYAHLSAHGSEVETFSNYPRAWQVDYLAKGYADVDPVVMTAITTESRFAWNGATLALDASPSQRAFLDEARRFGICAGTSIPCVGAYGRTSLLTFATSEPDTEFEFDCPILAATTATLVDVHAQRCQRDERPAHAARLTAREKTCLTWAANGNKAALTGRILGTAETTVEFHLRNAKRKLGAQNTTHAVALAIRQQVI